MFDPYSLKEQGMDPSRMSACLEEAMRGLGSAPKSRERELLHHALDALRDECDDALAEHAATS